MQKKQAILFLTHWYPTKANPSLGIFIQRHAHAASLYSKITLLHVFSCSGIKKEQFSSNELGFKEIIVQYPKIQIKIPIIGELIKLIRYVYYNWKAIRKPVKEFQLVQVNVAFPSGIVALLLKWFYGLPYIVAEHWTGYLAADGSYKGWILKTLTHLILKNAKAVITVSEHLKNEMLKHGLKNSYYIIPNVVDEKIFYPIYHPIHITCPELVRGSADQPIHILHVSTLNDEQKNISGIIRVVEKVKNLHINFVLHLIGEGPEKLKYEQLCEQKGLLTKYVKFYGYKEENVIAEMMRNSHFLLLFSNYENLPCVMLEAMMCGLPVISSNVGGVSEHLNKERGILAEPKNEDELLNAILLMIKNYNLYNKADITKYAVEHFERKVVGEKFLKVYSDICSNKKTTMKEVTVQELKEMRDSQKDFQLIDVREKHEVEVCEIGGEHIPMGEVMHHVGKISKQKPVIIHCRSGARSAAVVNLLEKEFGFTNLYNLKGGILAYADQIDKSLQKY